MTSKIVNDIYAITSVPKLTLETLFDKVCQCVGHAVWESTTSNDTLTEVDIGIGTLYVKLESDIIKYKFIPSEHLNKIVQNTAKTKESPLISAAESSLKKKIENTYKELL